MYNTSINNQTAKETIMTNQTATQVAPRAAYLVKQDNRVRYSFGKVWNQNVLDGKVHDTQKLLAQAVKLKAGKKSDLRKVKVSTLLAKVQAKLQAALAA